MIAPPLQAQRDPGRPDLVVIGNLDNSPIVANPGETIGIPVWIRTDDTVIYAHIPFYLSPNYFDAFSGGESFFPEPCTSVFRGPGYNEPHWAISILYMIDPSDEDCYLLTDYRWEHMADVFMTAANDTSLYGDTTPIASYNPGGGGLLFALNDGITGFEPLVNYGSIFFPPIIPGDANRSNDVNGLDVVYIVNYLKGLGPAPDPLIRGDANGDCVVNGMDVVYLVNYLKGIGPAPIRGECP